eukprot:2215394-Prymnesium_polylepis.1
MDGLARVILPTTRYRVSSLAAGRALHSADACGTRVVFGFCGSESFLQWLRHTTTPPLLPPVEAA